MSIIGYNQTGQRIWDYKPEQNVLPSGSVQGGREGEGEKVNVCTVLPELYPNRAIRLKPGLNRTCRVSSDWGICRAVVWAGFSLLFLS